MQSKCVELSNGTFMNSCITYKVLRIQFCNFVRSKKWTIWTKKHQNVILTQNCRWHLSAGNGRNELAIFYQTLVNNNILSKLQLLNFYEISHVSSLVISSLCVLMSLNLASCIITFSKYRRCLDISFISIPSFWCHQLSFLHLAYI